MRRDETLCDGEERRDVLVGEQREALRETFAGRHCGEANARRVALQRGTSSAKRRSIRLDRRCGVDRPAAAAHLPIETLRDRPRMQRASEMTRPPTATRMRPVPSLPPAVRHEAALARETNERVRLRAGATERVDPHDKHAVWSIESAALPVRSLSLASVTLPADVPKFVGDAEAELLQTMLFEVRELNERFVGEPQIEAFVRINGTTEQRDLMARGRAWAERYTARRLAQANTRDAGCEYRRFLRLWKELTVFLDRIGLVDRGDGEIRAATASGQYLGPMCDLIAWSFFQGTWARDAVWSDDRITFCRPPNSVDRPTYQACLQALGVYRWKASREFDRLIRDCAAALAAEGASHGTDADERARITLLAEDIAEMRPFLVHNYPYAKSIIRLPGGLYAGFRWDTLDRIGALDCGASERELLTNREAGISGRRLAIGHDGLVRCSVNWFRDVATLRETLAFPPLAVGRAILELVHARLYSFFDKIDLEAVCASWRGRPRALAADVEASPESGEDEAVVIAASIACQDRRLGTDGRRGGRVATSLRLSELSTVLERSFGCTSRSSKGSELVFYREGERHAFVARHKSNPLVPAIAIQRMLRKLGIGVGEWLVATGA